MTPPGGVDLRSDDRGVQRGDDLGANQYIFGRANAFLQIKQFGLRRAKFLHHLVQALSLKLGHPQPGFDYLLFRPRDRGDIASARPRSQPAAAAMPKDAIAWPILFGPATEHR